MPRKPELYPIPITELARQLGVSRQRVWQMRKQAEHLCMLCGNPLGQYACWCDVCVKKRQDKTGRKPWVKEGERGRPPHSSKKEAV